MNLQVIRDRLDIEEGLTLVEGEMLAELAESVSCPGMTIIEIGSWKGHSTSFLAPVAKRHNGKLIAVDHWRGNEGTFNIIDVEKNDIFVTFRLNMKELGLWGNIKIMMMDSDTAVDLLHDSVADFIFLDADHRYTQIKKDIEQWSKKVKPGGILSGHDCERMFSSLPSEHQELVEKCKEEDFELGVHCGVIKALWDTIKDDYIQTYGTRVWYVKR